MAAMKEMKEMMAALEARINMLEGEVASSKVERAALKAEVAALKKSAKTSKATAKKEDEGEKKVKKPSVKLEAWLALCYAVRAVHKKHAMKIAKILKDGGNMEPTEEDIKAAASQLPEKEGA
jgi:peptidoglycan hydrolase CwlO-like protein